MYLARKAFIDNSNFFMEILGSAGTGKTAIMRRLKVDLKGLVQHHRLAFGDVVHFSAPTGTAAKLLPTPTATLHSLLGLPIHYNKKKDTPKLSEQTLKLLQHKLGKLKILFIDELSFLGARMLYNIDAALKQIKANNNLAFGGVSIILLGDVKQLSPVADMPLFTPANPIEKNSKRERAPTQWERVGLTLYLDNFKTVVILDRLVRQADDLVLQEILNFI